MEVPKTDLVVGIAGALVLTGLVVGLFAAGGIGDAPGSDDDGTEGNETDDGDGGVPDTEWDNRTFEGALDPGISAPEGDEATENTHDFTVPNGTYQIQIGLEFETTTPGDLDCHLYHPASGDNRTKYGDGDCHVGTAESPQGANFTLEINASQWGDWRLVVHTGKSGDANLNTGQKDYSVWVSRAIQV